MLTKLHLILAKIETTYGTDPVPTPAADAMLVRDLAISIPGEKNERPNVSASLSPFVPGKPVLGPVEVTFSAEIKGSGTNTVPPEVAPLLRACGFSETINVGDVTYDLVSTGFESVTIYAYLDGLLHNIGGCRGTVELVLEAGKSGIMNFSMQGLYAIPTDANTPSGASYDTTVAPTVKGMTMTIDSYTAIIRQLQLALNNEISKRADVTAAQGYAGMAITGRLPAGSIDPEAVSRATYDFWQNMEDAAAVSLSAILGSTSGNKFNVAAPGVTYDPFAWGDRDGTRIFDVPLSLARSSGDDELQIIYD